MCMAIEAYADGGVLIGLRRENALRLAAQTMMVSVLLFSIMSLSGFLLQVKSIYESSNLALRITICNF